jgi:hypothetical protein
VPCPDADDGAQVKVSATERLSLWGRGGGRCSNPDCGQDLVVATPRGQRIVIGEVAHIIGRSEKGPRGRCADRSGTEAQENLVLLCPTHHTMVDKSEDDYPPDLLREWKADAEKRVADARATVPAFKSRDALFTFVRDRLIENGLVHQAWGPESLAASKNPVGDDHLRWEEVKRGTVIPNNTRIIQTLEANRIMLTKDESDLLARFKVHAEAFAANAEGGEPRPAPQFPDEFAAMVRASTEKGSWDPLPASRSYVEAVLKRHPNVVEYASDRNTYLIRRLRGKDLVMTLINIYLVSVADVVEALNERSDLNCLVTVSNWNSVGDDAAEFGRDMGVLVIRGEHLNKTLTDAVNP